MNGKQQPDVTYDKNVKMPYVIGMRAPRSKSQFSLWLFKRHAFP